MPIVRRTIRILLAPVRLLWRTLPRWSAPTWRVVILAALILFFVEVPGRRTGPTSYAHGWPLAYLSRDYVNDPIFLSIVPSRGQWQAVTPGTTQWATLYESAAVDDDVPFALEEAMTPWSFAGDFSYLRVAADALCAATVLLLVGWIAESWYRRRPRAARLRFFQYRLRTLLLVTPALAVAVATAAKWRNEQLREQAALDSVKAAPNAAFTAEPMWAPPRWLPESLQKAGCQSWFRRITDLTTDGDVHDLLANLKEFRRLTRLQCVNAQPQDLLHIAEAPFLRDVNINGGSVPAEAIRRLATLPRLTKLSIDSGLDQAALTSLGNCASLEELNIDLAFDSEIALHGLMNLAKARVTCGGISQTRLGSLQDSAFPRNLSRAHFSDLPSLTSLELTNVRLNVDFCASISRLPALTTLSVINSEVEGALELDGCPALKSLKIDTSDIPAISLRNMPVLESLDLQANSKAASLELMHLPRLNDVQDTVLTSAYDVTLVDLPSLESMTIERLFAQRESRWRPPAMLTIREADGLPKVVTVVMSKFRFAPQTIRQLGRWTQLRQLDVSGSWFNDVDATFLQRLHNLESCNLSCTNLTAQGLASIVKLPRLKQVQVRGSLVRLSEAAWADIGRRVRLDSAFPNDEPSPIAKRAAAKVANGDPLAFWAHWSDSDELDDGDLPRLDGLHDLEAVNLWAARVTDTGLAHLRNHAETRALNLSATRITDKGLETLGDMTGLEALGLAYTQMDGEGFKHLDKLRHLKALDLADAAVTDAQLQNLSRLPTLERLRLAGTSITDAGLVHLKSLPNLRWLDLSRTAVTDAGLAELAELPRLQTLLLRRTAVHGEGLARSKGFAALETLDLHRDKLTPSGFDAVASLPKLRTLYLLGMWLSPSDWKRLAAAPELRELSIISDKAPDEQTVDQIAKFKNLKRLNVAFVGPSGVGQGSIAPDAVFAKLSKSAPSVALLECPNQALTVIEFWKESFDAPAGGRLVETVEDTLDQDPILPPAGEPPGGVTVPPAPDQASLSGGARGT